MGGYGAKAAGSAGGDLRDILSPPALASFVYLLLIVAPDFHARNRTATQHMMRMQARLIHILARDELAGHEFAGSAEAEKSVDELAHSSRNFPDDNGRC